MNKLQRLKSHYEKEYQEIVQNLRDSPELARNEREEAKLELEFIDKLLETIKGIE